MCELRNVGTSNRLSILIELLDIEHLRKHAKTLKKSKESWVAQKKSLIAEDTTPENTHKHRIKWNNLSQESNESLAAYTLRFIRRCHELGYDKEDQVSIDKYIQGLKHTLLKSLSLMQIIGKSSKKVNPRNLLVFKTFGDACVAASNAEAVSFPSSTL